ncbi:MAG: glycosyltransferase family 4 protein [Desulfuromonadaceae bacterium]|nr:glycosyltransferase family 4 protein [Desulfuromonadaceae bacterium]
MRIAIISPYSCGPMRGNIITVRRIASFLGAAGVETIILPADAMSVADMECRLESFAPDIIHAFHAGYCGEPACTLAERFGVPSVITITGSDINEPLFRERVGIHRSMAMAAAIVCFDDLVAAEVAEFFPETTGRIIVIPQGVVPLPVTPDAGCNIPEDAFMLLLPAALREVKNIGFPLRALAPLVRKSHNLLLVIAGGVIDQEYADSIREMLAAAPFASWIGEVPHEQMGALYARADVVLNCSHNEGMSNSLLEAMSLARPVLAVDIPGNRSLVHDNETGWLYRDEAGFRELVTRIMGDATLRAEVGRRAGEYVQSNFSPQIEADRYIELYTVLLKKGHSNK